MLALRYLLMIFGVGLYGSAVALVAYDIYLATQLRRLLRGSAARDSSAEVDALAGSPFRLARARLALQLAAAGTLALWIMEGIALIPHGAAGIRVSQIGGAHPRELASAQREPTCKP